MGHSNVWNAHRRNYSPGSRTCVWNSHAIIRKYGLTCCGQLFRNNAKEIRFIKCR
ncbi:40S ribosomal protein S29-like [Solanum pennellii]|uniref:40S ribosomal protein S29-like n=1 Tax=Solanum pennellii TaxID=28526 RepID=A0ABM1FDT1_SOLPN|nr:40S ribosomal protein S29-like [Solanum pennellii]